MQKENIYNLYEKLYFNEVEAREKISSRLQIPLALLLSLISVFAHILKGICLNNYCTWNIIFGLSFVTSFIFLVVSISYFIRSFYGHTYDFLPSAIKTENYRQELIETYRNYEDGKELSEKYFEEYLFKYYNECSSKNTEVNDKRSELLHKCNTYLILCALPLAISFLIFTFAGIDKNSISKEYKIKITNPVKLIEDSTSSLNNEKLTKKNLKGTLNDQKKTTKTSASSTQKGSKGGRENTSAIINTEESRKTK